MNEALRVEILGTGCKKCKQLEFNAREAVASCNLIAEVVLITDMMQIAMHGVLAMPALIINDEVVSQGKVITADEILPYLG